jgi:hypothetical protein
MATKRLKKAKKLQATRPLKFNEMGSAPRAVAAAKGS